MRNSVEFDSTLSKFGIGLFETIKIEEQKPLSLDLHMNRIINSIKELNIDIDILDRNKYLKDEKYFDDIRVFLEHKILSYLVENNIVNKALRLTVFDKGYNISVRDIPYNKNSYEKGFRLNISPIKRGNSIIYKHKTTNYFENIYTKNYAKQLGFDDGIFLDLNDVILECSMSNIFFIKENTIYTPSSELPILNGTMKTKILNICNEISIEVVECHIKRDKLKEFDFVFITNSLMEIMKVTEIDGILYNEKNVVLNKIFKYLY